MWNYKWFQSLITWCRKWGWFDKYIWGNSLSMEDFVRNPAEVLRDTVPPFVFKNVKPYSLLNLRIGYIPPDGLIPPVPNNWSVPMGDRKLLWKSGKWVIIDLRIWNKWYTKYCNSMFFIQFAASFWHTIIPIPYVSLNFRIGQYRYFQFGLGWGGQINKEAETGFDACLSAKLRYVDQKTSNEGVWNPSDVVGYYEGTI